VVTYKTCVKEVSVFLEGDNPIFGESVTSVSVDDEAGGGFLVIKQDASTENGSIRLSIEELQKIVEVGTKLIEDYDRACEGKEDQDEG